MDLWSWGVGLLLIVATIAVHTTAVVWMAIRMEARIQNRLSAPAGNARRVISAVIAHIAAVALVLTALHGLEGVAWALAYSRLGGFESFTDASAYSLATMTTSEIAGLGLPPRWRVLGALEAVNGALLFGISTAFIFAVMQAHWRLLAHRHDRLSEQ